MDVNNNTVIITGTNPEIKICLNDIDGFTDLGSIEKEIFKKLAENIVSIIDNTIKNIKIDSTLISNYNNTLSKFKTAREALKNEANNILNKNKNIQNKKAINDISKFFEDRELSPELDDIFNKYKNYRSQLQNILKRVSRNMIKFQNHLSDTLQIQISFILTIDDKVAYKTYDNKKIKTIQEILGFQPDDIKIKEGKLNKIPGEDSDIKNLMAKITEGINQDKFSEHKDKIEDAMNNEEDTYNTIINRYNSYNGLLLWYINDGVHKGWQGQRISNKGPIEEARQGFLLRIHQSYIYNLFQGKDSEVAQNFTPNFYNEKYSDKEINDEQGIEKMIHNFIRSDYGVANTDKRSGLIIDDHLIKREDLLDSIQTLLMIDKKTEYVSIASKTTSSGYTGFQQFFTLIQKFQELKEPDNRTKERIENLLKYILIDFFAQGVSLTNAIEEISDNLVKQYVDKVFKETTITK